MELTDLVGFSVMKVPQELKSGDPFLFFSFDGKGRRALLGSSEVCDDLFCPFDVQIEPVVCAPSCRFVDFTHVASLIVIRNKSLYSRVICRFMCWGRGSTAEDSEHSLGVHRPRGIAWRTGVGLV